MNLKKILITENGWRHILLGACLTYSVIFHGNTDYAQNTKLIPSAMFADFVDQSMAFQFCISIFGCLAVGGTFEVIQSILLGSKNSLEDTVCTGVGAIPGFALVCFIQSAILFWISNAIIVTSVGLFIYWVYKINKAK